MSDRGEVAGEILDARVELRFGRVLNALLFVPALAAGLARQVFWGRPEIARPCSVVVFRKTDGAELVRYRHRFVAEAYDQLADLVVRLQTDSAAHLAMELDIPDDQVRVSPD